MAKEAPRKWFPVLQAARRVNRSDGKITPFTLGSEAKIDPSVASAWLGKFVRWGYARRTARVPGPKRWIQEFELTAWGWKKGKPRSRAW